MQANDADRTDYCSDCQCDRCRRRQQVENMRGALSKDSQARCWSCSCGWVGCYTRKDIAKYGEPAECNLCCRERLVECDPPPAHRIQSARNARAEALSEAKAAVRASVKQETGEYLWAIEVALEAIEALKGAE